MEDEYFVADGGRFAAVFDGHGGGGVSAFLKHHLYRRRTHTLEQLQEIEGRHQPTLADQVSALREAFNQAENDILQDDSLQYQGSTAVAVVVHDAGDGHRTVLSANVGDSRAILSRNGHAVELTRDHKPNEERERARILAMGETIEWDHFSKVHRVRNLSLSRAMGDRYAKPYVSAEVEIMRFPVDEHGDEFVLLASDGLWDVMTSQDVVSYVHRQIAQEMGRNHHMDKEEKERFRHVLRRNMSKYVAREALKRGSGDNVCVVMVWLDDDAKNTTH
jgi:serine/threonine protein phosphatase PrpC